MGDGREPECLGEERKRGVREKGLEGVVGERE